MAIHKHRYFRYPIWFLVALLALSLVNYLQTDNRTAAEKFDVDFVNQLLAPDGFHINKQSDTVYLLVSWGVWQEGNLEIMGRLNWMQLNHKKDKLKIISFTSDEKTKVDELLKIQFTSLLFSTVFNSHSVFEYLYFLGVPSGSNPDIAGDEPIFAIVNKGKLINYSKGEPAACLANAEKTIKQHLR